MQWNPDMNIQIDPDTIFIILAVLLFMLLGTAIIVVIDHKSKIPGQFKHDPFSIIGMRRDHPGIAFLTATILLGIILSLIFEITVAVGEHFGLFAEEEQPELIKRLGEQRFTERMRHFHNVPKIDKVNLGKKTVCMHCHGDYPHSKEKMVRSLLNMHTQFIGCVTCHVDEKKLAKAELSFDWLNFSGIEVTGAPFGTDIDPGTGSLIETDDYYSKIVVYKQQGNGRELMEITEDKPEAREYIEIHEQLSEKDSEAIKKAFHKQIRPKGHLCTRCHVAEEKSFLPLRQLGFSDRRIDSITNLNIVGIVQKYKNFYMPNMFGRDAAASEGFTKQKVDTKNTVKSRSEKDPRAWWKDESNSEARRDENATE